MPLKPGNQDQVQSFAAAMKSWAGWVSVAIAVGVAYFLTAQLGLALLTSVERVAVFWPASGLAVGLLIALGPRARAPVTVAVVAASVVAALSSDRSVWSAVAFALCNAAEALIVMWLIARWFGPTFNIGSLRRVLGFFTAAAVAAATAAVGAAGAMKLFGPSTAAFLDVWQVWFVSDALGIVTVAPLLIGIAAAVRDPPSWRECLEGTVAVVVVTATIGVLMALLSGPWSVIGPGAFLLPLLLWLGYRCRPVFAAAAVFTIATAIVWTTTYELGRYGDPTQPIAIRVSAAQIAMLGTTLAALALAALFAERRRSEAALGESDTRLRSILDAANVVTWDVDLARGTLHSAGPVARLLCRPEGAVPRDFAAMVETIHPEDRASVMAQFWRAVSTAATYRLEFRLNADGLCWVTAEGSIERDADGRPVHVRGITHDITERKKAELTLAEREAQLGLAGKAARVGSFAMDYATERIQFSPGYAAIHGLAEGTEELTREEWRARLHPDDLARLEALRSRIFAGRSRELSIEYRVVYADGKARWIESRGLVSYDGEGRPTRLVGVHIDITERKRAEDRLQESERKLRELLGALPAAIYVTDAAGHITYCNQSAADLWGGEPRLGKDKWSDLDKLHHADGSPMALADCPTEIALKQGRMVRGREAVIERRDRTRIPVIPYPSPLRDESGAIVGVVNMTVDISERKRAELTLADRNMQLTLAGKAALVGSYTYDVGADTLQVDDGYAALFGLPEGTTCAPRSEWKARVHPEDLVRIETTLSQAFRDRRCEYWKEYRIIRSGGEIRWLESRGSISYDGEGRPLRVVGVNIDISERKRAELALAERNLQLALAGKAALVGSFAYDVGTDVLHVEAGYAALHGLPDGTRSSTRSEWKGRVHRKDLTRLEAVRSQAFSSGQSDYGFEYRIVRSTGEVRWVETRCFVSYNGDGSPQRVVGVSIDITERKRAEDRLQESERKLRELLGALPAAIYVADAEGHVTYCNQSAVDLWGIEPTLGKDKWCDLARFYHADGSPMALADCPTEIALKQGHVVRGREAILERKDGTRIPINSYPTPLPNETGAIMGVVNMTVDISERKKAELTLAERNIQLALAGKAALVGSYAYDTDTELMQISAGYAAIHGLPEGTTEIARSQCLAGVHADDIGRVEQFRSEAFRASRREYSVEYRIFRPGGEMRWVETRCFITHDSEERPSRVIGVSIDITERKRVEEQQGKLVAELDHRVKNALATVQAVAAHTMQASSSMEHFVAALDGRIRSMGSTHELLSHRRWLGIPLAELVQRELAPYTTGSNTEIGGPDVMLSAEASQTMAMVLHELVTNAAKYGALSAPSGRVSIRWRVPLNGSANDRLVLTWRETGGPLVVPPGKSGYGMDVVRSVIPYELGGTVDHVLAPEGARCRLEIPLTQLNGGS